MAKTTEKRVKLNELPVVKREEFLLQQKGRGSLAGSRARDGIVMRQTRVCTAAGVSVPA